MHPLQPNNSSSLIETHFPSSSSSSSLPASYMRGAGLINHVTEQGSKLKVEAGSIIVDVLYWRFGARLSLMLRGWVRRTL